LFRSAIRTSDFARVLVSTTRSPGRPHPCFQVMSVPVGRDALPS